jgi:hypothetical protein
LPSSWDAEVNSILTLSQWVDRKAGLCGLYAGQVLPPGDAKCAALNRKFEAEMYKQYQRVSSSARL